MLLCPLHVKELFFKFLLTQCPLLRGWQYIWQHDLYSLNYTGFLAPLFADGARDPKYSPAGCDGGCEAVSYTYEALAWGK